MVNYITMYKCKNCGRENYITAEKGTTVKDKIIEDSIKCTECNCILIEAKEE